MKNYLQIPIRHLHELYDILVNIRERNEAGQIMRDILTPRELASVAERLQIIKQLARARRHREISKSLGVSIDKVTRGAKALRASAGGFRMLTTGKKWYSWRHCNEA